MTSAKSGTRSILARTIAVGLSIAAAAVPASPVYADALGSFTDWAAHADGNGESKTCWIYSSPKKEVGDYSQRGRVYALVTHRPGDKVRNQVQFTAGYTFKEGSAVDIDIDGKKFSLFTNEDTAWARSSKDDDELVDAMRAGSRMIVKGTSSRGTLTTDTYSLSGFTAAHKAIGSACGLSS